MLQTLVTWFFTALQYVVVVLMAPLTLAVCGGLLFCTWLITRQLHKPQSDSHEWLGGPTSEWLGA